MTRFLSALLLAGLLVSGAAAPPAAKAGEFNEVLSIGDVVPVKVLSALVPWNVAMSFSPDA